MRKIFIISAVLIVFSANCIAQKVPQMGNSEEKSIPKKAEKFDEFERIIGEYWRSVLDNFLVTLQNRPTTKGIIITYQGSDVLPANFDFPLDRLYRNHLNFRRFDTTRIDFINGGFRKVQATELWIVQPGAEMPRPSNTVPKPKLPKNKTFLYDRNIVESGHYEEFSFGTDYLEEFLLPNVKAKRDAEWREYEAQRSAENSDEPQTSEVETEVELPKTPEVIEAEKFYWLSEKFGEVIKNHKDSSGLMVFYADDQIYDIGKLHTFVDEGRRKIARKSKTPVSKIQILFGGFRQYAEVEFWIMPKNGKFPEFKPDERPVEETEEDLESLL